jgi:hypothetical protein
MAKPGAFDKDFGYLMPFLERVAGAAGELEDAAAREELGRLMAEEKVRWARIRELLGGVAGGGSVPGPVPSVAPQVARAHGDNINRAQPRSAGFTVGSLKRPG